MKFLILALFISTMSTSFAEDCINCSNNDSYLQTATYSESFSGRTFIRCKASTGTRDVKIIKEYKVNSLLSFKAGDEVVDSRNHLGTIQNVYADGYIDYNVGDTMCFAKLFPISTTEQEHENDLKNWINGLRKRAGELSARAMYNLAVKKESIKNTRLMLSGYLVNKTKFQSIVGTHVPWEKSLGNYLVNVLKNTLTRKKRVSCAGLLIFKKTCKIKGVGRYEYISEIRLVNERSKRKCIEKKSFGMQNLGGYYVIIRPNGVPHQMNIGFTTAYSRNVWVKRGCRGTFEVVIKKGYYFY